PVERGSQQRECETMEEFFARRQKSNRDRASRETFEETKTREQREAHASKGAVLGKKGARVFTWEKTNGYYIRRAAGHSKYEDVWEEYGPRQRRYDSFYNEWDVCEEFGPADDAATDDDDHDDIDDDLPDMLPVDAELEEGMIFEPGKSSVVDLAHAHQLSELATETDSVVEYASIAPFLGNTELVIPNEAQLDHFRVFLAHCQKAKSPHDIPKSLLDFHQQMSELYEMWTVQVRREILNGRLYYVVAETHNVCHLYILLESATSTLEIVRQGWGPSLKEVISKLLCRGVPFLTCFRCDEVPTGKPGARNPYSGLGFRPQNYKPDHHDYQTYVALRSVFLRSPRGRAALLSGGIIGRLARAVVPDEEVLRGPSDDATINGICLWDGHSQQAYWDDTLTEQEIDLICGVYHISTGWSFFFISKKIHV
ncbi:hypothetical protein C8R43DRAFT_877968, partial [Mycena crocata]